MKNYKHVIWLVVIIGIFVGLSFIAYRCIQSYRSNQDEVIVQATARQIVPPIHNLMKNYRDSNPPAPTPTQVSSVRNAKNQYQKNQS